MKIRHPTAQTLAAAAPSLPRRRLAWTDFQVALAIAQHGSVAKACAALGRTHATVLRRLDAIESRLKVRLFDRVRGAYTMTPAGQEIVQAAEAFAPRALAAETRILGQDLRPSGDVRVSVASFVIDHLLAPNLARFAALYPEVVLELAPTREHVNLSRREADVAIRIADQAPDWLIGRELGSVDFRIYGAKPAGAASRVRSIEALAPERRWIGFERDARELKFDRWLAARVPDESIVLRVDGFTHALTALRMGLGIALLPTFMGAADAQLEPLTAPIAELRTPLWLITHPELKNTVRMRAFTEVFGAAIAEALARARRDEA